MKQRSLGLRLALGFLLVTVLPLSGLTWFYLHTFEQGLSRAALNQVSSIANAKSDQLDTYINERLADARTQAGLRSTLEALLRISADFHREGLQGTQASAALYRSELGSFGELSKYHDLLLIDEYGYVVFSIQREPDLGRNLREGLLRHSPLGAGFRQALDFLSVNLTRFAPYAPSAGLSAAFAVAPILEGGRPRGAIALQLNLQTLTPLLADRGGLGATGETVLALTEGEQIRYTSALREHDAAAFVHSLPLVAPQSPLHAALSGDHGTGITHNQHGQPVVASWQYLPALDWGMVVQIDVAEALAPVHNKRRIILIAYSGLLLISLLLALSLGHFLLRSEKRLADHEARYRSVFGSISDGVALYRRSADGPDLVVLDINPAGERITGVHRAEILGRPAHEVFSGLDRSGILAAFERVWQSGVSESIALTEYHDERVNLWVHNEIIRLPGGELLSIFSDITARKQAEDQLNKTLANLHDAQRIAQIGNWSLDLRSNALDWSEEIFRIFEVDPTRFEANYEAFLNAIHPEDRERVDLAYQNSLRERRPYAITHRLRFADGRIKHVHERCETDFDANGTPLVSRGTVQDITELQRTTDALQLYANIFESSGEAILVTDHDNCIIAINPAFTRQTGYVLEDIQGQNPRILSSNLTSRETYQTLWQNLQESGYWQGELWDRNKNGSVFPKWAAISVIRDADGRITHHIASFTDISERKAAEERIEHLAHHDSLTGLFNRYNLEIRLSQALLGARRDEEYLAVMFIDLDRFKLINDSLTHAVGDQLLVEVAQRLHTCVRESDIVARQGGDEFVVVLTRLASQEDASPVANKILHALSQPYLLNTQRLHTSASIGISVYPCDGENTATLMKNADTAMYHAKAQGRNNLQYFTAALNTAAEERLTLERELRVALEEQQFVLYYQPQIAPGQDEAAFRAAIDPRDAQQTPTRSPTPSGVEALVRWLHPARGLIPPDRFIPIAEETGLIEALGGWVLDEAGRQFAAWKAAGIAPGRIAVNLSAHQLRDPQLVQTVARTLSRHGLGEGELELEITESVAMSDPAAAIEKLQALRALGVSLAIDDFGTGYSSLAYLKRLPIQILKLDRAFVRDLEIDANDAAISTATLSLAHSLGLEVIAEGVETLAQRDYLVAHGCDLLQGYLYGRPEPAAYWDKRWK